MAFRKRAANRGLRVQGWVQDGGLGAEEVDKEWAARRRAGGVGSYRIKFGVEGSWEMGETQATIAHLMLNAWLMPYLA